MDTASAVSPQKIHWETDGTSRIPFMAYTEADQHRKELERLFYRKHWCYVGLEAEIANPGDFKRTVVGERSVLMVRDTDGGINVVENVSRPSWHAVLPRAPRQPQGQRLHLPLPPVELHAAR
jgi:salicylate 5-hydroxylase large subunit